MPSRVSVDAHLEAFSEAADRLRREAARAGLNTAVPTCPTWTVADLVIHQGSIHRWAVAHLTGDSAGMADEVVHAPGAGRADDLLGWFEEGVELLRQTFGQTPPDIDAEVFLLDAPAPRAFWARRQAHETTVHAVDAWAATLGRLPRPGEMSVERALAVDGVDELLTGFLPRPRSRLRADHPYVIAVVVEDADAAWTVSVSADPVVTERGWTTEPDAVVRGSASDLYLALWNRTALPTVTGRSDLAATWRHSVRVL